MKNAILHVILLALALITPASVKAQTSVNIITGHNTSAMQAAIANSIGAQRAVQLKPVMALEHVSVLSDAKAGFAIVGERNGEPIVYGYGDKPVDPDNVSPEFLFLLSLYNDASDDAASDSTPHHAPAADETTWPNISPMLTTTWAQGSPYYDQCPIYYNTSSRCVTGCVATAMAQVLNYYELPKTMHGKKSYVNEVTKNDGSKVYVTYSFDFGATTFDWANMKDHYGSSDTQAQKNAVAQLMYACGVATNMHYSPNESYANTWNGTDAINSIMDGLRAEHVAFTTERVIRELRAGHPVIYSGSREGGGAHCFVIDGCKSDGTLHLNLGWGGGSDGYYLPTNMANYSNSMGIECVWPSDEVPTYTPINELKGKFVKTADTPATSIETGKWYVLWNSGRAGSPMSNGVGKDITNTSLLPDGMATTECAPQLVRFVTPTYGSGYYIQTGLGDYFGSFSLWGSGKATSSGATTFSLMPIEGEPGYFGIRGSSSYYLDTNGPGGTVVNWGSEPPANKYSNKSWQVFPVIFSDTDPDAGLGIGAGANFNNNAFYTLKNTGYSQGYLVAIDENDTHPTLRGVTQDHSDGLYDGALYHDDPDVYNPGHYWQIITEGRKQYLVNYGTGKYLTYTNNETRYYFTDQKTPINIVRMDDGTFRFNTSTEAKSYLCAATQFENPAANWTYTDDGSIWQVEEAIVQRPYVAVTSVDLTTEGGTLLDNGHRLVFKGTSVLCTPVALPENATDGSVTFETSDSAIASVATTGLIAFKGNGVVTITARSVDNPDVTGSITFDVLANSRKMSMGQFNDGDIYLLRNVGTTANRYSQGYLVALSADDEHPTLRGVEVIHPSHGCSDDHYLDAPDLLSPYSYWQIFSDGTTRYLYNVGVGKFLTNEGNQTKYVFTDEPTPININTAGSSSFNFNTGNDTYSYLCAATHLDNPAAFWNAMDVGTYWSVEAIEGFEAIGADSIPTARDFFDVFGRTIGDLVRIIGRLPDNEATLDDVERTKRYILHQKQQ